MPNIRKFLDLSTAHLDEPSKVWLSNESVDSTTTFENVVGWFSWAHVDVDNPKQTFPDESRPPVLNAIYQHAIDNGCDYVLFDCDAEVDAALPTFDYEEEC